MRAVCFMAVIGYSLALATSQVARFATDQETEILSLIRQKMWSRGLGPVDRRVVVVGERVSPTLWRFLEASEAVPLLRRVGPRFGWPGGPRFLVLPDLARAEVGRNPSRTRWRESLATIVGPESEYRVVARLPPSFLQSDFYQALDPTFGSIPWQGDGGYTLFER